MSKYTYGLFQDVPDDKLDEYLKARGWLPITDEIKNGEMLLLLVKGSEDPLDDSQYSITIGYNTLHDINEDEWRKVGWCWQQDHYKDDFTGEVLYYQPIPGHEINYIKFRLNVKDSHRENGFRGERIVDVLAKNDVEAYEVYYELCGRYECEVLGIRSCCLATKEDYASSLVRVDHFTSIEVSTK